MASASLARAGFLRSGSYQPRNMASSCGVSPPHAERRVIAPMVPEHPFFFQQPGAYVRHAMGVTALSGWRLRPGGSRLRLRGEEGEMMWVRGDRLHSPVSNFLNFLNFRG